MRAEDWDQRWSNPDRPPGRDPNRFLVAEIEGLPPGRALDLACGAGRNAVWLAERGWAVTAVDFSPVALAAARALAAERSLHVDWTEADLLAWSPPEAAYDLVAILYLQVPEAERRAVLAGAAAAVAPGGTLLLVAHDLANLDGGHGGPRRPAVLTTPEAVAAELPGLLVERAERVERPVDEGTAIDTLVRAARPAGPLSR